MTGQHLRDLPVLRWVVYAVVTTVAVFAFVVSYSHIYDLGRVHAQFGTAARLLPLSVDLLIVAASLVLFIQYREDGTPVGLARWLPRLALYAGIGATVAANVFYGLPYGWLAAVISGWPGAAFVAAVEVGMVIARPAARDTSEPVRVTGGRPPSAWLDDQILVLLARMSVRSTAEALGVSKTRVETAKRRAASSASEGPPAGMPEQGPPAPAGAQRDRGTAGAPAPVTRDVPAGVPSQGTPLAPAGTLNGRAQ